MELQPVLHVWINHDNDLVDLTLTATTHAPHSNKTAKTSEVIHTNKKHPFLTKEQGFVPVGQLKVGMHVREADGQYGVITGWKLKPGTQTMYNLEVAQDHTFTVGDEQWVVHNQCSSGPLRRALNIKRGDPFQAQHLMPCELAQGGSREMGLVVAAQNEGLDINSAENGIALPNSDEGSLLYNLPGHLGSHGTYTNQVRNLVNQLSNSLNEQYGDALPEGVASQAVKGLISQLRAATEAAGGGCTVNQVDLSGIEIP